MRSLMICFAVLVFLASTSESFADSKCVTVKNNGWLFRVTVYSRQNGSSYFGTNFELRDGQSADIRTEGGIDRIKVSNYTDFGLFKIKLVAELPVTDRTDRVDISNFGISSSDGGWSNYSLQ